MSHPLYLSTRNGSIPLTGFIKYVCPECGREMFKGAMCPTHQRPNVMIDTRNDDDEIMREAAEREFVK